MVRLHEASSHSAITRWIEERNERIRKESGCCSRADGYSEEEQDHGEGGDGNGLKEHIEWKVRDGKGREEFSSFSTLHHSTSEEKLNLENQIH